LYSEDVPDLPAPIIKYVGRHKLEEGRQDWVIGGRGWGIVVVVDVVGDAKMFMFTFTFGGTSLPTSQSHFPQ
jgi:hypothetical protein